MKKLYILSALFVLMCLGYQNTQAQTNYYVVVTGSGGLDCYFTPASPTIGIADSLYFVYGSGVPHTCYSTPPGNPPNAWTCLALNLANDTCGPYWFDALGSYPYNCNLHGGNGGTITVATVGINDPKSNEYSKVLPNPFHNTTIVFFNGLDLDRIEVYNLMGQQITSLPIKSGANQIELDLTGISSGVYFYRLLDEEGIIETKRLVKTE